MSLVTRAYFFLLLTSCGFASSPEHRNMPSPENIAFECVLSEDQIKDYQVEPLVLIQKVITYEPALGSMPFQDSLSAWQACYKSL
jgi:hypothetical protein